MGDGYVLCVYMCLCVQEEKETSLWEQTLQKKNYLFHYLVVFVFLISLH